MSSTTRQGGRLATGVLLALALGGLAPGRLDAQALASASAPAAASPAGANSAPRVAPRSPPLASDTSTGQGGAAITFDDALRLALRQNSAVLQAENAADLSSASVRAQKLQFLPSLQISSTGAQNLGRNFSESQGAIINQNSQSLNAGISSSVTLFDGLSNVASLHQANLASDASGQDLSRARQTAAFTVASNYLTLVTDQEQLKVQQENLAAQEALEAQIEKMVQAGSRAISDQYQQQAVVAAARSSVTAAQRDLEVAKVGIIQTLQLDPSRSYDFVAPTVGSPDALPSGFDLDSLLARAYANRADLASAATRVSAASQGVKAAAGAHWPTVSLSAGYSTSFNSAAALSLADQLDERRGGSVALSVSIPIFDQGRTGLATQQAQIDEDNARLALESARQTVGLDVRKAKLDYDADRQQLAAAVAQRQAGDLAVSTAQKRYEAGAGTLVEVTQARATQVQAASAEITARYAVVFQAALMSYYTGELDPNHLTM
ncbi:MAG: TolC family protein [Gemmatimonadales bacterium]